MLKYKLCWATSKIALLPFSELTTSRPLSSWLFKVQLNTQFSNRKVSEIWSPQMHRWLRLGLGLGLGPGMGLEQAK